MRYKGSMALMLDSLRKEVIRAHLELVRRGLVMETFGNVSAFDRASKVVVIKPSGVPYESLRPEDLVLTDLQGRTVAGTLRPSTDLVTHLELYRALPEAGAVIHTHSRFATIWAQAKREIPCVGTTHADYFPCAVPVTRDLMAREIEADYEFNTAMLIVKEVRDRFPLDITAVLVASHGPFCWGPTVEAALHSASILEEIARMAYYTMTLNPAAAPISNHLLNKHYSRKHGRDAYYGQAPAT